MSRFLWIRAVGLAAFLATAAGGCSTVGGTAMVGTGPGSPPAAGSTPPINEFPPLGTPSAGGEMTVTFIRHGESLGNASDTIDTTVPGPGLTDTGRAQAQAVANAFAGKGFDCVYASEMVRTQQTAAPLADRLGVKVGVLPGLDEIRAGDYEGTPLADYDKTYAVAPAKWLDGELDARMPGGENGTEFNKRVADALSKIAADGCRKPAVFSHSGTIMYWTVLNTDAGKDRLATQPLANTAHVVITGGPDSGWRLSEWSAAPIG